MRRLKAGRVFLNSEATDDLNVIIGELKKSGPFISGSPSDLASFILSLFKKKYFEKEKSYLKKQFFDDRSYAKDRILKSKSDDEFYEDMRKRIRERDRLQKKSHSKAVSEPQSTQEIEVDS